MERIHKAMEQNTQPGATRGFPNSSQGKAAILAVKIFPDVLQEHLRIPCSL